MGTVAGDMTYNNDFQHAEDCAATEHGGECEPRHGGWHHPSPVYVDQARRQLDARAVVPSQRPGVPVVARRAGGGHGTLTGVTTGHR
jgi:hypothetical protein